MSFLHAASHRCICIIFIIFAHLKEILPSFSIKSEQGIGGEREREGGREGGRETETERERCWIGIENNSFKFFLYVFKFSTSTLLSHFISL
jgi:hypothetical protein